jgi:hypothetical protein
MSVMSTGLIGAILGMDFVLGKQFSLLTFATVPVDAVTLLLCVFVLHDSPK